MTTRLQYYIKNIFIYDKKNSLKKMDGREINHR